MNKLDLSKKKHNKPEFDDLYKFILCTLVHTAAFYSWIHKGSKSGLCDKSGSAGSDLSPQIDDNTLREAVALELFCSCKIA